MNSDVIEKYKKAGRIAANAREYGISLIKEGALAFDVAEAIESYIREKGAKPAFPANLSVNYEAAHYTPAYGDKRRFKTGDVVKVDVGAHIDGYIGDTSRTVEVGTNRHRKLIMAAEEGLDTAMELIKDGEELDEVGSSVENVIRSFGFKPIENLTGHSLEQYVLHSGTSVPSVHGLEHGLLHKGMAIAVEPFATDGAGYVVSAGNPGIYRVQDPNADIRKKELAGMFEEIVENFGTLPFAGRWCFGFDRKADKILKALTRKGYLQSYDVLTDAKKGTVAQREKTMIITEKGVIATTEAENGL